MTVIKMLDKQKANIYDGYLRVAEANEPRFIQQNLRQNLQQNLRSVSPDSCLLRVSSGVFVP